MKRFLVIADDLTGAAEMAGIGLRYGLIAQISRLQPPRDLASSLTVIDTDSRLLSPKGAATRLRDLLRRIDLASFDFIYKKTDSVLRGNIVAEVSVLLEEAKRDRCVLLAQNPSRGRTIRDGHYCINNVPLHQTEFGSDPDRPIRTSRVQELLNPPPTILVQDASTPDDVAAIAKQLSTSDLPAGGADFFEANLVALGCVRDAYDARRPIDRPKLFICGSASENRLTFVEAMREAKASIFAMPDDVFRGDVKSCDSWKQEIALAISGTTSTVVYIPQPIDRDTKRQAQIRETLAKLVAHLRGRCVIGSLFLEGGATAAAVCDALNWHQLEMEDELEPGTIALSPKDEYIPQIIVKPGSYPWCARALS
jgi:uncharacterized protein YgbK (DUF1537 family)